MQTWSVSLSCDLGLFSSEVIEIVSFVEEERGDKVCARSVFLVLRHSVVYALRDR